jgi:hypothetical protein
MSMIICVLLLISAGGMHSSSPSSTDANDRFRKGASGGSGNQRFDDSSKDENGEFILD